MTQVLHLKDLRIVQISKTIDVQKLSIKFLQEAEFIKCGLIIRSNLSSQKRDIIVGTSLGRVLAIEKSKDLGLEG